MRNADYPAYDWEGPLTVHFFTGRSMTQRLAFWALQQDERAIAIFQLCLFWGTALLAQRALRTPRARLRNFSVAAAIALAATSFNLGLASLWVIPAPMFLVLLGALALVLVRAARGAGGRFWIALVGVPFVFSKNLAPPMALACLAVYAAYRFDAGRVRRLRTWLHVIASPEMLVAVAAIGAAVLTQRYDTSLELNAANNVFRRVLPDPALTAHFEAEHGLPSDPLRDVLRGRNVLAKLRGKPIYRVDPDTGNYELIDVGPLSRWLVTSGEPEYVRHLALHPLEALSWVRAGLRERLGAGGVHALAEQTATHPVPPAAARYNSRAYGGDRGGDVFDEARYLEQNPDVAGAVRDGRIASGWEHYRRFGRAEGRAAGGVAPVALPAGLLGGDPLAGLAAVAARVGFCNPELHLLAVVALLVVARRNPHLPGVLLAAILVAAALPGLELAILMEALGDARHLAVPTSALSLGLGAAILEVLVRRAHPIPANVSLSEASAAGTASIRPENR
jgi:hypothetical protein